MRDPLHDLEDDSEPGWWCLLILPAVALVGLPQILKPKGRRVAPAASSQLNSHELAYHVGEFDHGVVFGLSGRAQPQEGEGRQ